MAEIGSPTWVDELARSVADVDPEGVAVTVVHRIDGGPGWVVVADGTAVDARPAADGEAGDVSFTWQRADAEAVAAGTTTVLAVFQAGRLRVGGDLRRLADATALFSRFPGVAA
jgi:alkyl sulfatase BDS1-like metallo-beta-lactamase superfamily hydrolase